MSSWFDKWDGELQEIEGITDEDEYFTRVAEIEAPRVRTISLLTGDVQFPTDYRDKIQNIIALWGFSLTIPPTDRARSYQWATKCSRLSSDLHSAFHDVAREAFHSRFGRLSDNPKFDLDRRDEHDGGK